VEDPTETAVLPGIVELDSAQEFAPPDRRPTFWQIPGPSQSWPRYDQAARLARLVSILFSERTEPERVKRGRPKIPFFNTKFSFEKSGMIPKGGFGTKFAFKESKCNVQIKYSPSLHCPPKASPMFDYVHKYSPSLHSFGHSSCTLSQPPADGASSSDIHPQVRRLTGFLIEIKHLLMPLSGAMEEMAFRNKL
jgi:hypothetical protein